MNIVLYKHKYKYAISIWLRKIKYFTQIFYKIPLHKQKIKNKTNINIPPWHNRHNIIHRLYNIR